MKVIVQAEEGVVIPSYAHDGDAGMDIRSNEEVRIFPGESTIVKTGLKVVIPEGYYLAIVPRSGLSAKTKLRIANAPGTIDSNYRGEIGIILENTCETDLALKTVGIDDKVDPDCSYIYKIEKGDRIAQMILKKYETIEFESGSVDDYESNRGSGGYGSSGVK